MKRKNTIFCLLAGLLVFSMAGCSKQSAPLDDAPTFIEGKYTDFTEGKSSAYTVSDGWSNKGMFGCTWSSQNLSYSNEGINMKITKSTETGVYYGGEQKSSGSDGQFKYGYFGTYMKAAKAQGTTSTFFTYTGSGEDNPHDEIDVEILGKDTTKVQFNYFVDGTGNHEYMYDLGFDSSEDFHQYGFYWDDTKIIWFVDLQPVYSVTGTAMPSASQRIFQNFWVGDQSNFNAKAWLGSFNDADLGCTAYYKKVTYAGLDGSLREVPEPEKAPSLDELTTISSGLNFPDSREYVVTNASDNMSADVTYEGVTKSYHNITAKLPDSSKTANLFAMKVENKGEKLVNLRVDLQMDQPLTDGGIKCANTNAYYADGGETKTDLKWGGSFFEVPVGKSITLIVKYYGPATNVILMPDSSVTSTEACSGHLLISNYMLGGTNEYVAPKDETTIDESAGKAFTMDLKSNDSYTVSGTTSAADITYADLKGNSYKNVYCGVTASEFTDTIALSFHIKNNGTNSLRMRIDVSSDSGRINASAEGINVTSVSTDLTYGGSFCTVAAGEEGVFRVIYSGTVTKLLFMFDTSTNSDSALHSGSVSLSHYLTYGA